MAAYWEIAAHSAYDMCSYYTNMIIIVFFFFFFFFFFFLFSGNFFLIASFPDHCLLLPFCKAVLVPTESISTSCILTQSIPFKLLESIQKFTHRCPGDHRNAKYTYGQVKLRLTDFQRKTATDENALSA